MKYIINLASLIGLLAAAVSLVCMPQQIQTDLKSCLIWCTVIVLSLIGRLWLWEKEKRDAKSDAPDRRFYDFRLR